MSLTKKILYGIIPIVFAYYYFSADNFDPASVAGKRVLVTGASAGIGEHVAYKYAQLGAKLVITARRKDLLEKVAQECRKLGAQEVHFIPADMSSAKDRAKLVVETERLLGGLDVLILNHAAYHYAWWTAGQDRTDLLHSAMEINFFAYVDITSRFLKALEQSGGQIGIVSSLAGKKGFVAFSHYCATKHALQGFYASLRQELKFLKKNVSVTLIVYGPVVSEGTSRMGEIEEFKSMHSQSIEEVGASSEDAADVLVRGVAAKVYEVHFPKIAVVVGWMYRICPGYTEDLVTWAMTYQFNDHPEKFKKILDKIF